jgi:chitinase
MNKKNVTLAVNKTSQHTLWGANDTVTWKSSNNKVATVSDTGLVKAKSVGEATITATFNGKKISSQINVVELNTDKVVLEYGGMFDATRSNFGTVKTLKVIGSQDKVSWTSSNKNVATVNSSGKVTAKGPGNATITANINGAKITCNVKVLQMSFSKLELSKGENFSLNVLGTDSPILWFSNKKSVAIVSEDGVVTAKNKGTAKIIAEVDGILVRSIVTVK